MRRGIGPRGQNRPGAVLAAITEQAILPTLRRYARFSLIASHQFLTYFINRFGPTSAPTILPMASAATPSAALEPVAFSTGSGMKAVTDPSLALPTRMPRFQPS